jgi:ABC-type antimicrobial peptide transport system permease subunit
VMRVLGLSKTGFVLSIFLQALMFVLPSIVLAFVMVVPSLTTMYKLLFTEE